MMTQAQPSHYPSPSLERILGVCATISFPALWTSGVFGEALSWHVTIAITLVLGFFCWMVPSETLAATLKILLIVASTSIALCVADAVLRIFGGHLVYYRAHSELLRKDTRHPALYHYVPNRRSERTTFGDLAAMSGDPSHRVHRREFFATDDRGFRNATQGHQGPFDLLILGDSFGMGLGSTQDETWASILETQGLSLYNLSMPATCPAHGAARLALEIPSLPLAQGATIVVPVYTGNDLEECTEQIDRVLTEPAASGFASLRIALQDYRSRSPLRQFALRLVYRWIFPDPVVTARDLADGRSVLFYKPHARATHLSASEVARNPNFSVLTKGLANINAIAKRHGASMLVVILPPKEEVYDWILRGEPMPPNPHRSSGIAHAIESFCSSARLRCVDLTPQCMAEARVAFERGELLWWTDDSHWNHEGHKVAARLLTQALETK